MLEKPRWMDDQRAKISPHTVSIWTCFVKSGSSETCDDMRDIRGPKYEGARLRVARNDVWL
jgi:hypothetical protein